MQDEDLATRLCCQALETILILDSILNLKELFLFDYFLCCLACCLQSLFTDVFNFMHEGHLGRFVERRL